MAQYVDDDKFYDWYRKVSKEPRMTRTALMQSLFEQTERPGDGLYKLDGALTLSGEEETYPFVFDNIGCCGASTGFYYF